MAILMLKNGKIKEYKLPTEEKEKSLYDLWYEIHNKRIKIIREGGRVEYIRLIDIEDCLIGEREKKYKKGNMFDAIFDKFNELYKTVFGDGLEEFPKLKSTPNKKNNYFNELFGKDNDYV